MTTEFITPTRAPEVVGLYEIAAHRVHRFDQFAEFPISIGRSRRADIQLAFDASISSLHCVIERVKDELIICDCRSTNGIVILGAHVTQYPLRPGTRIFLGRAELCVMGVESKIPIMATTDSSFLIESRRVYGSARAAGRRVGVSYMTILRAARRRATQAASPKDSEE